MTPLRSAGFRWGRLVGGLTLALAWAGAAHSSPQAGWTALTHLQAGEALRLFAGETAPASSLPGREARFGRAIALLAKQPVTTEQIDEAQRAFTELADGGADDVARGSRYFLGRIAQHHRQVSDPEEAARQFRQLIAEDGTSIWAQTALTRLAVLELYALHADTSPASRLATVEKLLDAARLPTTQSELHLVLADAIFYFHLPEVSALPHLLAAESLGQLDHPTRGDVLVQIAEVSASTGDRAQARRFYETFLAEFPLDQRRFMVKQKKAKLDVGR